ncbi:hypothetical protein [Mycoplasmopsis cynos]|uniref:hypothetical protein n=1 Tax=Mycoplasmopsis cynos TaxID=171284 RepID=UPI002206F151|nr:hypothetical protein [Mycoplasmopsis cynos]UWV77451.1 hypothetical protein NW070_00495 [Mycoplasmopsis cynos]
MRATIFQRKKGWTIDLEKSTRDGNSSNLPKLIDRSGNYRSSASRWDNWGKFGEEQDTNLVFHWEEPTNISRFEVNFWLYASKETQVVNYLREFLFNTQKTVRIELM